MNADPIVGIDLGTSNSCVAYVGPDGVPRVLPDALGRKIIPSVVSFHPNGQVLVGAEAKERRVIDPKNTVFSVKRLMGRRYLSPEVRQAAERSPFVVKQGPNEQPVVATRAGEFAVPEISAIVLDHLRQMAETALGTRVERVVITVPANFNDAQRQATATAGEIAELIVVRILNEPTAAALAYGHGRRLEQTVAVYDFGGGTLDVTILALRDDVYEVLATAGDMFLGGDDIDDRIVDDLVDQFLRRHRIDLRQDVTAIERLRAAAERAKCELSIAPRATVRVEKIAVGEGGRFLDLEATLDRDGFVRRIDDIVRRSFPVCDEVFRLAGLSTAQIDEVVLVGGTTRIPYVRDCVAKYFGRVPRTDVNPDEAVALGAALQAAALSSVLDRPRVTRPGVGVSAVPPPLPPVASPAASTPPPLPPAPPAALGRMAMKKMAVPRPASEPTITEVNRFAVAVDTQERTFERGPFGAMPAAAADSTTGRAAGPPPPRPVLLDVTPRGLAVATVGGYCDEIIRRNSPIPVEQTRVFTTAQDDQTSVEIKVCQGESRRFDENILLGTLHLTDLPPRPRGVVRIAVTFEIDANGILRVSARDEQSGRAQDAEIHLLGAQSREEVDAARARMRDLRSR